MCIPQWIYDITPLHPATENDATIMRSLIRSPRFGQQFIRGETFVFDCGFRNVVEEMRVRGYRVHLPAFLQRGATQQTSQRANESRS